MFDMLLPKIARSFGEKMEQLEQQEQGEIRLTLETQPILQQDLETTQEELFLRTWLKKPNLQGCIEEKPFADLVDRALEDDARIAQMISFLAMTMGQEIEINAFLADYFEKEKQKNEAQKYFYTLRSYNESVKTGLARKQKTKRVTILETMMVKGNKLHLLNTQKV